MPKGQTNHIKCWRCGHSFKPANWCPFCGVHDPVNKPDFRVGDEIYASLLQPGMFFRKAKGVVAYMCFTHYTRNHWLEIRNNAKPKKFTKMSDPKRMHIWGVSSVGNLTGLCHDRKVVLCDEVDFVRGIGQGRKCYEASITYPEDWGPGSEREHPMVGCDGYDEGPLERLIDIAKVLKSDGRNPEYDRALVEIVCGFAGEGGHGDWFKKLGIKPAELFAPSDEDEPGERTFINGEILQFVGRYDRLTLKEGEFVAVAGSQKVRCDDRPDKEILTYWRNNFGESVSSRIPANHLERTKFKSLEEARTHTKLTEVLSLANQAARQVEEIEDGDKFVLGLLQEGDKFILVRDYAAGINLFKKGMKVKIKGDQTITSDEQLVKVTLNGMLTFNVPYNILQRQAPKHNGWPIL